MYPSSNSESQTKRLSEIPIINDDDIGSKEDERRGTSKNEMSKETTTHTTGKGSDGNKAHLNIKELLKNRVLCHNLHGVINEPADMNPWKMISNKSKEQPNLNWMLLL
jgi:hypothetical protein